MTINEQDLDHIIKLAHLNIPEQDQLLYLQQLNNVFNLMKDLDQIDTSAVNPDTEVSESTPFRKDTPILQSNLNFQQNAPNWEANCFKVPKII